MVFHWGLSDSKSPQISRTLLSILVDLNNVVVWVVFTCPLISKFSSSFNNPSLTVPKAPITIGINVTFMFHSFIIIIIIIITSWEFFASVLADGLSLECEWQQVSSNL